MISGIWLKIVVVFLHYKLDMNLLKQINHILQFNLIIYIQEMVELQDQQIFIMILELMQHKHYL